VTWHADRSLRRMQHALDRYGRSCPLGPGLGLWRVWMPTSARIKDIRQVLPRLIGQFDAANELQVEIQPDWPREERHDEARRFGIAMIYKSPSPGRDLVYFSEGPTGGLLPDDPDLIVDWLDEVVSDPEYADLTEKL